MDPSFLCLILLLLFFPGFAQFPDTNTPTETHPMELIQIGSVLSMGIKSNLKECLKSAAEWSSLWKFFSRIHSNEAPSFDGLVKYFKFIKRSLLTPAYFSSFLCHLRKKGWHSKEAFRLKCWDYRDISLYFTKKEKSKPKQVKIVRCKKSSTGLQRECWRFSLFHYLYFPTVAKNHIPTFHVKYNALNWSK